MCKDTYNYEPPKFLLHMCITNLMYVFVILQLLGTDVARYVNELLS